VADTQAGMGYMISQCLMNELAARGKPRLCSTVVTTVRVDKSDPAFAKPTKPIGSFLTKEQADQHSNKDGWNVVEDAGRGWRRVVPSPIPREIVELEVIRSLIKAGQTVISCGGGGIPVVRDEKGQYTGVEAVIDKDRTSALVANSLGADMLALWTGVDQVQSDYGKPTAKSYPVMKISEARALAKAGQFPAGSMGPKVESAIDFLERSTQPKAEVMITSVEQIEAAIAGKNGTRIIRD
jgi:carbamate kinase